MANYLARLKSLKSEKTDSAKSDERTSGTSVTSTHRRFSQNEASHKGAQGEGEGDREIEKEIDIYSLENKYSNTSLYKNSPLYGSQKTPTPARAKSDERVELSPGQPYLVSEKTPPRAPDKSAKSPSAPHADTGEQISALADLWARRGYAAAPVNVAGKGAPLTAERLAELRAKLSQPTSPDVVKHVADRTAAAARASVPEEWPHRLTITNMATGRVTTIRL